MTVCLHIRTKRMTFSHEITPDDENPYQGRLVQKSIKLPMVQANFGMSCVDNLQTLTDT